MPSACVIDAPLLIEADLCGDCDLTIAVLVNKETRIDRISKRDLIDCERATSRVNSQKSDRFYIESTDIVINNDGDISSLQSTIESVLSERGLI